MLSARSRTARRPPPMSLPLPSFLRRRLLLFEARRALLSGEPEAALEHLADPCLAASEGADRLRAQALEVLCAQAERLGLEGRERSAVRILGRVERESPHLARAWRKRLRLAGDGPDPGPDSGLHPRVEARIAGAMGDLLARLRAEGERVRGSRAVEVPPRIGEAVHSGSGCLRFHLAVDEGGEVLCVHGERIVLGHSSSGRADLPVLGDVDAEHLVLARSESFHGGPAWRLEPLGGGVEVAGQALPARGCELVEGDLVRIAPRVAFRFRRPEPASGSALLEFLHGLECEGATRVLLFLEGPAGRVRLGPRRGRHLVVPGLEQDVELELCAARGELAVRSQAALEVCGWDPVTSEGALHLPCPPPARIDVRVGTPRPGAPPQGFALRGLGPPSSGGGRR